MTKSRELAKFCQESVRPIQSKNISNSLNNYNSANAIEFLTKSLIDDDKLFLESNQVNLEKQDVLMGKPIFKKVMDYIENHLLEIN